VFGNFKYEINNLNDWINRPHMSQKCKEEYTNPDKRRFTKSEFSFNTAYG